MGIFVVFGSCYCFILKDNGEVHLIAIDQNFIDSERGKFKPETEK